VPVMSIPAASSGPSVRLWGELPKLPGIAATT